jgi:hypothetical protein
MSSFYGNTRKPKKVSLVAAQGLTEEVRKALVHKNTQALTTARLQLEQVVTELAEMETLMPDSKDTATLLMQRQNLQAEQARLVDIKIPNLEKVLQDLSDPEWNGECRTPHCGNFVTMRLQAGIETHYCAVCAGVREQLLTKGVNLHSPAAQEAIAAAVTA